MPLSDRSREPAFLLVDDNSVFLELLDGFVRRYYPDARIARAASGEEAIARLTTARYDVVLLADCVGGYSDATRDAMLDILGGYGRISNSSEFSEEIHS